MKAIVSKRRGDGTYAEVGMTDRLVLTGVSLQAIALRARRFAPCRVEIFGDNFYGKPARIIIMESAR